MAIDIFDVPYRINLVLPDSSLSNWNSIMDRNSFKIQKGTKNVIEFVIRNNDRKPINIRGKTLQCNVNYKEGNVHLIRKKLEIVDANRGLVTLSLYPHEMVEWPIGVLEFNVTVDTEDGYPRMLYVRECDHVTGYFEINDGPYLGPVPTMTSKFYREFNDNVKQVFTWYSDIFAGSNRAYNPSGLMTFIMSLDNFSGTIKAFGSLETSMPQNNDNTWFKLDINGQDHLDYSGQSGTELQTIEASVNWVMFTFEPENFDTKSVNLDYTQTYHLEDHILSFEFRNC